MVCPQCGTLNDNTQDTCKRCTKPLHPATMKGKIACYVHANREATTSCGACGRRLCAACAVSANGIEFCDECAPAGALRQDFDEDYEKIPVVNPEKAAPAPFVSRMMAYMIDVFGLALASGVIGMIFWLLRSGALGFINDPIGEPAGYFGYRIVIAMTALVYVIVMTAMSGQTFGKQIMNIIVLQEDGRIMTLQATILRTVASILSLLPLGLGFWWMLWDKKKQTWHDKISGTAVYTYEEVA